jgi:hypothetical protein
MSFSNERRSALTEAAAVAYQRARVEVFDLVTPGTLLEWERLTPTQRQTLDDLDHTEIELADFRFQRHLARMTPGSISYAKAM